jgi:uroporphyrinogen-III synthase
VTKPLLGRAVVVTRAVGQSSALAAMLAEQGARVIEVPTIAIVDAADQGAALNMARARIDTYDWLVVTSPNGASRLVDALRSVGARDPVDRRIPRVAVVGPGTADVLGDGGIVVDLVPGRFVGEGLVEAFEAGPGTVLLIQAADARPVVAEGLKAKGWTVDVVVAYRTVPAVPDRSMARRCTGADAVMFASASAVANFVAAGLPVPPHVVCIGPITAESARVNGLMVTAVAHEHSLAGLVDAAVAVLGPS